MAVTVTAIRAFGRTRSWDVTMTADGDTTTGAIAHGFGVAPDSARIEPRIPEATIGQYRVGTIDATNLAVVKGAIAASGAAGVAVRLVAVVLTATQD